MTCEWCRAHPASKDFVLKEGRKNPRGGWVGRVVLKLCDGKGTNDCYGKRARERHEHELAKSKARAEARR